MLKPIDVYYLGHSGFAVESSESLMVFDYWQTSAKMLRPIFDQAQKKSFIFSSHSHHDHYDRSIEEYKKDYSIEAHFVGWRTDDPRHISVEPDNLLDVSGIKVFGLESNDDGLAFFVEDKDIKVFHGGDLAGWEDETWESFTVSIDNLKNHEYKPDIAFLAVTTFSGVIQKRMVKAAEYLINTLKPSYFFPMHSNHREYLYKNFKEQAFYGDQRIICPEYPGEKFMLEISRSDYDA